MDLETRIKGSVLNEFDAHNRPIKIDDRCVDNVVRVLLDFADASIRSEITPYDAGAPTRLVRIILSHTGDTIDVSLVLEVLRKVLAEIDDRQIIRRVALMEGILYAALVEHVWHESFSARFASEANALQGIFEFRSGILPPAK